MKKLRRTLKIRKPRPRCSHPECFAHSDQTQECLTCEALLKEGKCDEIFTVHWCMRHAAEMQRKMGKHVFVAHPINIPKAMMAALRGEEI